MRTITRRMTAILILLVLALGACTWPPPESEATVDVDAIVAETMQAFATYAQATLLAHDATPAAPEEQGATDAPAEPSETPAPPTVSASSNPIISVSVDTNCRTGPGQVYDYVGALLVGEEAEITARESTGRFWYIRNPDGITDFCWVWDEYATVRGDIGSLPVLTPPPTPTPVPGSISGIVYLDGNHNGQLDPTDGWISGSILELIPGGCAGVVAATTESSSVDGSYSFNGLIPGSYCVRPSPLQQTMDPLTRTVIVDPGENVVEVLFRYVP
ncbi:MAG: hypothetical protein JXA97_01780 [Anaerolineales bacterium]|nr:hypothetical protein [Anaerolineales bacterium]